MKVLVTGATGFIGRQLIGQFGERGVEVTAIVRRSTAGIASSGVTRRVHDGTTAGMIEIVRGERPDVVVHLAAQYGNDHTAADVDALLDSNIRFGVQLLEGMRAAGTRRIVCAGTFWQHFGSTAYSPVNLYAATKQAFEDLAAYYVEVEGFEVSHLRLFGTYGPGDGRGKLVSHLLASARSREPLDVSPGEQLLDLVHVSDAAAAFVRAAERLAAGDASGAEVFAVTSGRLVSLRELVQIIEGLVGQPLPVRFGGIPYRRREVMRPWQGVPVPGWTPRVTLESGLRGLIAAHAVT